MKLIVPMAGMGKRLRPHTLTMPKPLLPIAGRPIVQRLVEDIIKVCEEPVEEIAFVIGNFGEKVEAQLKEIATAIGAKGSIYYQDEALGTAHAILCAKEALDGKTIVAFADTLFQADFSLNESQDGIIWVKKIDDPSAFGVVKLNDQNIITDFVEKPETFVSDLAIIGIYYFKDGAFLRKELEYVIDNDIRDKGEYQLTTALENMKDKGTLFSAAPVSDWLDCGNKDATVSTNKRILEIGKENGLISHAAEYQPGTIIEPCYIGKNVTIENSSIGPFVSIGDNTTIKNARVENSIILANSLIESANINNSMIGNHVVYSGNGKENRENSVSIGDYSSLI
ncbi:MAG TPA: nucleotidyltransferase [Flavobacteriales bacterium]|nr:nucleotidyltransferase [Flavobacteriales bacterium]HIN39210.1 nucleotidyltransferase [Flavobacteriales bacterium]